jgi:hypothetical protein
MARQVKKTRVVRNGKAKVAKLRLDAIRLDAGTQTRAHIDDCTVAEYAEAMLRGGPLPARGRVPERR